MLETRTTPKSRTPLSATHPDLATQLACPELADTLTAGSSKVVSWTCHAGHTWDAAIKNRAKGNGCPFCSGRKATPGVNDLKTTHPALARELVDKTLAVTLGQGSHNKVQWRCRKGHTWDAAIKNRTRLGSGCPTCSGRHRLPLADTHPELAQQLAVPSLGTSLTAGSMKTVEWVCPEPNHTWSTPVFNRVAGNGCPFCAGRRVLPGYNDLATTHPALAVELTDQALATTLTAGSSKKVSWRCPEGHQWDAKVAGRVEGKGCSLCAPRGFSSDLPGCLYAVTGKSSTTGARIIKVGIANTKSLQARLATHAAQGLTTTVTVLHWADGQAARDAESQWRTLRASLPTSCRVSKQQLLDGYTEAVRDSVRTRALLRTFLRDLEAATIP